MTNFQLLKKGIKKVGTIFFFWVFGIIEIVELEVLCVVLIMMNLIICSLLSSIHEKG